MAEESRYEIFRNALIHTAKAVSFRKSADIAANPLSFDLRRDVEKSIFPPADGVTDISVRIARGKADSAGLRIAYHDASLHASLMPGGDHARFLFGQLERARYESAGAHILKGMAVNLLAVLDRSLAEKEYRKPLDANMRSLADAVALMLRERLTGMPSPPSARIHLEIWRETIEKKAGDALDRLAAVSGPENQKEFALCACKLIRLLDIDGRAADGESGAGRDTGSDRQEQSAGHAGPDSSGRGSAGGSDTVSSGFMPDRFAQEDSGNAAEESGNVCIHRDAQDLPGVSGNIYRIYTSSFDETADARKLCSDTELGQLRRGLDHQLENMQTVVMRLAGRLQRRLMARQAGSWEFDLEEGILDASRITRVITSPAPGPLSFKMEKEQDFHDTVVTLLIDNSGSMRGRPVTIAAICADILARTLERCGVKTEILGFTTRTWKGGRCRKKWVADGSPDFPGRLNELRHIVYKSADMPWRRARASLGLMLKEGILKENIDGEALLWAHARLLGRPENRRILMVISDGAPVDDATSSSNDSGYLEDHLRRVIDFIETKTQTELLAIGIGHDVTRYYRRAVSIHDVRHLADAIAGEVLALFRANLPAASGKYRV